MILACDIAVGSSIAHSAHELLTQRAVLADDCERVAIGANLANTVVWYANVILVCDIAVGSSIAHSAHELLTRRAFLADDCDQVAIGA